MEGSKKLSMKEMEQFYRVVQKELWKKVRLKQNGQETIVHLRLRKAAPVAEWLRALIFHYRT